MTNEAVRRVAPVTAPPGCAGDLVRALPTVAAATPNDRVMEFWRDHPDQEIAAVLDGERPVGLLSRQAFMESWAKPFQRELYGRRGCEALMDRHPLVVDVGDTVSILAARAVSAGARVLRYGFVACCDGRYAGVGTGFAILEASTAAESARAAQLLSNVEYASVIQRSQLETSRQELSAAWPASAVHWEPRDIVAGDCFLFRRRPEGLIGAVLDCTGHGVSGAFMTLIGLSVLERALDASGPALPDPGALLGALNVGVKRALGQFGAGRAQSARSDDGLDGAVFVLPAGGDALSYAGARLPLLVAGEGPVDVVAGTRVSVGYRATAEGQRWPSERVPLPASGALVLATDGVTDQIGGPRSLPFGRRGLTAAVAGASRRGAPAIVDAVVGALRAWQGAERRRDDVTLVVLSCGGVA
jgi:serine phosphatase RsbU (regulator of sigma subunit)